MPVFYRQQTAYPAIRYAGFTDTRCMAARVIVHQPADNGARRILVDGQYLGTAFSLHDLAVPLERADLEGWDGLDTAKHADLIDGRGGGSETWV